MTMKKRLQLLVASLFGAAIIVFGVATLVSWSGEHYVSPFGWIGGITVCLGVGAIAGGFLRSLMGEDAEEASRQGGYKDD